MIKEQCIDLLISHNQILIRSRAFDENVSQWKKGNIAQGAILNKDYVIFDPLPEDAFGANVILSLFDEFIMDKIVNAALLLNSPLQIKIRSRLHQLLKDSK